MKFEANIPSYLRTGAGVFPVKEKSMPKRIESTNFYEMAKQGFNMPIANDTNVVAFAPVQTDKVNNPRNNTNFLDEMQMMAKKRMGKKPIPGQQKLPGDFPTTGELNDRETVERYNKMSRERLEDKVIEIDDDIFID